MRLGGQPNLFYNNLSNGKLANNSVECSSFKLKYVPMLFTCIGSFLQEIPTGFLLCKSRNADCWKVKKQNNNHIPPSLPSNSTYSFQFNSTQKTYAMPRRCSNKRSWGNEQSYKEYLINVSEHDSLRKVSFFWKKV